MTGMIPLLSTLALLCAAGFDVAAAADRIPAQRLLRNSDHRPRHDDAQLKSLGIVSLESKHLKLYTDVAPEKARAVLPAVDAAYDALVAYFGPLPPDREGDEFQVTGYLMANKEPFRRSGLLPGDLPRFLHGRHRGLEFWANEQETDYYRRHLAIHEFTHCFMYAFPGAHFPNWYMEGTAELFGTHRIDDQGRYHFRVMPDRPEHFASLGRISMVRRETAEHRWKSLDALQHLPVRDYLNNRGYAWSWAACAFLNGHPRYSSGLREIGKHLADGQFHAALDRLLEPNASDLNTEWSLFSHQLQHGFDLERAAIRFETGQRLEPSSARTTEVAANRGWQPSGVLVRQGESYEITATGSVTLGNTPKPWLSQAQGISIFYSESRPIGLLLGAIRSDPAAKAGEESMLKEIVIGPRTVVTPEITGTLYLRINDHWGSLADNHGHYQVEVRAVSKEPRTQ